MSLPTESITASLLESPLALGALIFAAVLGLVSWSTTPPHAPDLPGPWGWPIVGNLFQRGTDPADTYHKWSKIYGPVFRIRLGNKWVIVINGAEAADELLASPQYGSVFQSRPMVNIMHLYEFSH